MPRCIRCMLGLLLLGAVQAAVADALARVDRGTVALDETFTLTIELPGENISAEPDLGPLQPAFEVLGTTRSTQVNVVNGQTDARTYFSIQLAPRRAGEQQIPPSQVGNERTNAVLVEVTAAGPASAGTSDILLEVEATPLNPYVQSQVTYTVRLLHANELREGSLSEPELENA